FSKSRWECESTYVRRRLFAPHRTSMLRCCSEWKRIGIGYDQGSEAYPSRAMAIYDCSRHRAFIGPGTCCFTRYVSRAGAGVDDTRRGEPIAGGLKRQIGGCDQPRFDCPVHGNQGGIEGRVRPAAGSISAAAFALAVRRVGRSATVVRQRLILVRSPM